MGGSVGSRKSCSPAGRCQPLMLQPARPTAHAQRPASSAIKHCSKLQAAEADKGHLVSHDVGTGAHPARRLRRHQSLALPHVPLAEQELAVQVARLDRVHVDLGWGN